MHSEVKKKLDHDITIINICLKIRQILSRDRPYFLSDIYIMLP